MLVRTAGTPVPGAAAGAGVVAERYDAGAERMADLDVYHSQRAESYRAVCFEAGRREPPRLAAPESPT